MIKVVLFDLGGVLVKLKEEHLFAHFIVSNSQMKIAEIEKLMWLIEAVNKGKFLVRDAYHFLCEEYKFNGSYSFFADNFNNLIIGNENCEIGNFIRILKPKFKIMLLSNTNALHFQYVKEKYDFFKLFDRFFLSYKMKLMKPERKIYKTLLRSISYRAEEILFIDDTYENIEMARQVGMSVLYNERNSCPISSIKKELLLE